MLSSRIKTCYRLSLFSVLIRKKSWVLCAKVELFIFIIALFILTACSEQKNEQELTIATNSWIGYTPLFYAKEKGYLTKLHIKLLPNVSLAEASNVYSVGKADMVTTTQHEYYALEKMDHNIVPIILLDRSYGGDMVLSNRTISQLKKAKKIDAYLEIDSINAEILKDFMKYNHLQANKITFIDKDQGKIADLKPNKNKNMLIVTYSPYNIQLETNGFKELASTKNMNQIKVIDALCTNKNIIANNKQRLKKLKAIIDKSIREIQVDPKSSYDLVKPYLNNISFGEYVDSLNLIKWINKPSKKLLHAIEPMGYKQKQLIQ